ncbi:MAG: DUF72 domain-containing protein [Desulfobulbaceae bacterium]|nr:MAG: DUF72 domain-containing protein [Desulfobulbaceae bacterium]
MPPLPDYPDPGMGADPSIRIGTCSWKYDSWEGLVYTRPEKRDYLAQYSRHYSTVEVDQWFWSLFESDMPVLPRDDVVREYAAAVPPGFVFTIKVPNSITLTHHYRRNKDAPLVPNPHFLSIGLMERFIRAIEPLAGHIGPLMFQFEYLNRQKMAGLHRFLELFSTFRRGLPGDYRYCIETRNPNWLRGEYFDFLAGHGLGHVFLQGYYMPPVTSVYWQVREKLVDPVVIRLHGGGREEVEHLTGNAWNRIVAPKDGELVELVKMVRDLQRHRHDIFINVNNHYEGSAPLTIKKIYAALERQKG